MSQITDGFSCVIDWKNGHIIMVYIEYDCYLDVTVINYQAHGSDAGLNILKS